MMDHYTHPTYPEMANAIIARAEQDGSSFPGIIPFDDPAIMACGYMLALARSKRTVKDQWNCPIWTVGEFKKADPEGYATVGAKLKSLRPQS